MPAQNGNQDRWYCPVESCPKHCQRRSAGWMAWKGLNSHLAEHAAGRLEGEIPCDFLSNHRLGRCTICSKVLSLRFGNACPSCRPDSGRVRHPTDEGRPLPSDFPTLDEILQSKSSCKAYVPQGAKKAVGTVPGVGYSQSCSAQWLLHVDRTLDAAKGCASQSIKRRQMTEDKIGR